MCKPDTQELKTYAAESIMGWKFKDAYFLDVNNVCMFPLHDSNHLDLIEAELVNLGVHVESGNGFNGYMISLWKDDFRLSMNSCKSDIAQIRLTRLTVYVEAHRKLKEND